MKIVFLSTSNTVVKASTHLWLAYWQDPNTGDWKTHKLSNPKEAGELVADLFDRYGKLINVGTIDKEDWPKFLKTLRNGTTINASDSISSPWLAYWKEPDSFTWKTAAIKNPSDAAKLVKFLFKKYDTFINVGTIEKSDWPDYKRNLDLFQQAVATASTKSKSKKVDLASLFKDSKFKDIIQHIKTIKSDEDKSKVIDKVFKFMKTEPKLSKSSHKELMVLLNNLV